MATYLKVFIPQKKQVKAMRFAETDFVSDVIREIREKTDVGGADHGIFVPLEDTSSKDGQWLTHNKSLAAYDLSANQYVEYRKKHQVIEFTFLDGNKRKVQIDVSEPPSASVQAIAVRLSMSEDISQEFSLKIRQKGREDEWMNQKKSLLEQIPCALGGDQLVLPDHISLVFSRKYYFHDCDVSDAWSTGLVYEQVFHLYIFIIIFKKLQTQKCESAH